MLLLQNKKGVTQVPNTKFEFTSENYIGRSNYSLSRQDPFLKGAIDDFRIYSYALEAKEIKELANL